MLFWNPPLAALLLVSEGSVPPSDGARAGPRVLFTIDGEDYDHLGRGLLGLPDIDRDGTSDLLLSAVGHALVCSGKTGCLIYRLDTPEDSSPDPLPRYPELIGDHDGDGIPDFSLEGQSSFEDFEEGLTGYVSIYSSASGRALATYGGEPHSLDAVWATRARNLGDLDGDGDLEVLVEAWERGREETRTHSLGSDALLWLAKGSPVGATPDVDGDGDRDVLLLDRDAEPVARARIVSGRDGRVLSGWDVPTHAGSLRELSGAGDVDGDGCPDVVSVFARPHREKWWPSGDPAFDCDLISGRGGTVIHSWTEELVEPGQFLDAGGLDDLDGDGIREVFVSTCDGDGPVRNRVRIYSGATRELVFELTSTATSFGSRVCSTGDLDGDRVPELLVSEFEYGNHAGRVWVCSLGRPRR